MTRRARLAECAAAALLAAGAPVAAAREAIVGGTPAAPGSWPSIVALVDPAAPSALAGQFCGGTLVDSSWVLTAEHCTYTLNGPMAPEDVDVIAGITDLNQTATGQPRTVAAIVRHPTADVAMLRLASAIAPSAPTIATMDIASALDDDLWAPGRPAAVAGWGSTDPPGATFPSLLQEANVTLLSDATCSAVQPWGPSFRPSVELCADEPAPGSDPCVGDSGGPLTVGDAQGRRLLVGAVSFGSTIACGDTPVGYARLGTDELRNWVYQTVLGRTPAGPVSQLAATTGGRAITLTWTAPASVGSSPILGYVARVRRLTSAAIPEPTRSVALPVSPPATLSGLEPGHYDIAVSAVTAAGTGPAARTRWFALELPPRFTTRPTIGPRPRVGGRIAVTDGTWTYPDGATDGTVGLMLEACDRTGASCAELMASAGPGYRVVPAAAVGLRLRARVRIGTVRHLEAIGYSDLSPVVAPTVKRSGPLTVTRKAVIRGRVATQPRTTLSIQVLDRRGRKLALSRSGSTIDGRTPKARGSKTLVATLKRARPAIAIALANPTGRLQKGTLVIQATNNGSAPTELRLPVRIPS